MSLSALILNGGKGGYHYVNNVNNILVGKVANLDVVFSGMYSTIMDNRAIENIGDLKLHFGATKPPKTMQTHGDWVIAWRITFKVM